MAKKKRQRKGLVIGYLERISSSVFDTYQQEITDLVGGKHGIYALYRNNQLYYVGLATNLKGRLRTHLRDRHAGRWNFFSLYLVRNAQHLKDLESLSIRVAYPKGNRALGKFGGVPDLEKTLKRTMTKRAISEIEELLGEGLARPRRGKAKTKGAQKKAKSIGKGKVPLKGLLKNKRLRLTYKGRTYYAKVLISGRIKLRNNGKIYDTPSGAAKGVMKREANGWGWWRHRNKKGEWVKLGTVRK